MAECCKGSGCQELATIGFLKDRVDEMPTGITCSVEIVDGTTASTCCNQGLSGDYQVIKKSDAGTIFPIWVDDIDPSKCVNGFDLSGVTTASTCCGNMLENDYVLAQGDMSLKSVRYSGFTYGNPSSSFTETTINLPTMKIEPCYNGRYDVSGTAKYNKYIVRCSGHSSSMGSVNKDVVIASGTVSSYHPSDQIVVSGFSGGSTNYSSRSIASGSYRFKPFSECNNSITINYSVEQDPINIVYDFSLSGNGTCASALTVNLSANTDCVNVDLEAVGNGGSWTVDSLGINELEDTSSRFNEGQVTLSGTVSNTNGDVLLNVNIDFNQNPCSQEVDGAKGCGIYWVRTPLGNEYDGDVINRNIP